MFKNKPKVIPYRLHLCYNCKHRDMFKHVCPKCGTDKRYKPKVPVKRYRDGA